MSYNILGIIPARGGSKGIPRKNIKEIAGRPLIAWTIEAAEKSKLLDKYVVSTEDEEIASVAEKYGADILRRPSELATDEASTLSVLQHAIENIPLNKWVTTPSVPLNKGGLRGLSSGDIVVLLQATSPIRHEGLIDDCIKEFIDNGYDSLATGFICKYVEYGNNELRRQDINGFFYDDGNVYVIKADLIRSGDRYGKKIGRKIISRWENQEIDDEFDFWIAEKILLENNKTMNFEPSALTFQL